MSAPPAGPLSRLVPPGLRGYRTSWLRTDVVAGLTLAAVAIPETMGYTSIAGVPVVTGLYTVSKPTYTSAKPGAQSAPGLLVFRYDADLFYANANQFSDDVQQLVVGAPDPVRWLVLDCTSIPDVDYSAGAALDGLITFVHNHGAVFALAAPDPDLRAVLAKLGVLKMLNVDHIFDSVDDAVAAFRSEPAVPFNTSTSL